MKKINFIIICIFVWTFSCSFVKHAHAAEITIAADAADALQEVGIANALQNIGVSELSQVGLTELEHAIVSNEGKVVIVNFFATWCPPCIEEIPSLIEISEERADNVVIIGLSVDEERNLLPDFIEEYGMNYPVYFADYEILNLFRVSTIPHNAIFDQSSELVANQSGYVSKRDFNRFIDEILE